MSDGPFKALKARPHWKNFFKSVENAACSEDEIKAKHDVALSKDFDEVPMGKIRDILQGPTQGSLLPADPVKEFEALRTDHPGSAATDAAINCARDQVRSGVRGETAFVAAMQDALKQIQRNQFRSAKEHLQRNASSNEKAILGRLNAIGEKTEFAKLAADLCSDSSPRAKTKRIPKQTDLDQGPRFP